MGEMSPTAGAGYEAGLGLAWLSQYGCSPLLQLLPRHGAEAVWFGDRVALAGWGVRPAVVARFERKRAAFSVAAAWKMVDESGLTFIPFGDALFPPELGDLHDPPAGLFVKGSLRRLEGVLHAPRVTVVGTRRSTPYGNRVAALMASAFAERGVVVVSGLALGIDGRAHQATLDAGGMTLGVLGCGADIVYPPRHRRLFEEMESAGVVISELPPGVPPARWTFPHRNRLLAALGDAVLVVEGSSRSGALQTAGAALELGRPVFAVPGLITAENHQGCNWLIYDGAAPAIEPSVTVEEFFLRTRIERKDRSLAAWRSADLDSPEATRAGSPSCAPVLEALGDGACSVDGLVSRTLLEARQVTAALSELEIRGLVVRSDLGLYIRAP
jgi:DNA processing protein